jgi:hypothetical protein
MWGRKEVRVDRDMGWILKRMNGVLLVFVSR